MQYCLKCTKSNIIFFPAQFGFHGLPNRPYSSMSGGYLSTQGHLVGDHLAAGYDPLGLDNSASYLGMEAGPGGLRDTAISGGFGDPGHGDLDGRASLLASHRFVGG